MAKPKIERTFIDGVYVITPVVFEDSRGYFYETFKDIEFSELGLQTKYVQENQSKSFKGVLRGLHFQKEFPQGKLIRVISGRIFDVAVDIRKNSKTFMSWYGIELDSINRKQLYIEPGLAHGFLVLSDVAEVVYKCTEYYHPEDEGGIIWDDPNLKINWPVIRKDGRITLLDGTSVILNEKDRNWDKLL